VYDTIPPNVARPRFSKPDLQTFVFVILVFSVPTANKEIMLKIQHTIKHVSFSIGRRKEIIEGVDPVRNKPPETAIATSGERLSSSDIPNSTLFMK